VKRFAAKAAFGALIAVIAALVLPAGLAAASDEPSPEGKSVWQVLFDAPKGSDLKKLKETAQIKEGEKYSQAKVGKAIKLIYGSFGSFSNVKASVEIIEAGVILRFVCQPKIYIESIKFVGAKALEPGKLESALKISAGDSYRESAALKQREEIIYEYLEAGFPDIQVSLAAREIPDKNSVALTYIITEGERQLLTDVKFKGNMVLPLREVKKITGLDIGAPASLQTIKTGLERLREKLFDMGYYEAKVSFNALAGEDGKESGSRASIGAWKTWELLREGVLRVTVKPGRKILFRFRGNRFVKLDELYDAIKFDSKKYLEVGDDVLDELASNVKRKYELLGYMRAKVTIKKIDDAKNNVRFVVFNLEEGTRVLIKEIIFRGASFADKKALYEQVLSRLYEELLPPEETTLVPPDGYTLDMPAYKGEKSKASEYMHFFKNRPDERPTDPKYYDVYIPSIYEEAIVEQLRVYYATMGFLKAQVSKPTIILNKTGQRLWVYYDIAEGPRTIVKKITVKGAAAATDKELLELINFKKGDPLNRFAYPDWKREIKKFYQEKGYLYADVRFKDEIDAYFTGASSTIEINEGPRVKVGAIIVKGAALTIEAVILDRLAFGPGDYFTPGVAKQSEERLMKLGVFQAVSVKLMDRETPEEVKNILVSVIERPPGEVQTGVGVATDEGARARLSFAYRNIFGTALEYHVYAKLNMKIPELLDSQFAQIYENDKMTMLDKLERNIVTGFRYPSIFGVPWRLGLGINYTHIRLQDRSYGLDKNALGVSIDTELAKDVSMSFLLEAAYLDLELTSIPFENGLQINEPEGTSVQISPELSFNGSWCDNQFNPTSGFRTAFSIAYFKDVAQSLDTSLIRAYATLTGYTPIKMPWVFKARPLVFKTQVKAGYIFNLIDAPVSEDKMFFLGGRLSLRGWPELGVYPSGMSDAKIKSLQQNDSPSPGGQSYLLFKFELRVPLYKEYALGVFCDSGNLWASAEDISLNVSKYRTSLGFGAHYMTPVGEISLDFGFPVVKDNRFPVSSYTIHFSIGMF